MAKFTKGKSGNPRGRPRKAPSFEEELKALCREAALEAIPRLRQVVQDGSGRDSVAAARLLLGYGLGLPGAQPDSPQPIDAEALRALIERSIVLHKSPSKTVKTSKK